MKIWNALSLALLLVTIVSLPLQGQKWNRQSISGTGGMVTQTLDIDNFDKLGVALNAKVILTQGNTQSVTITGQQNIIDIIEKDVNGRSWDIGFPNKYKVKNYDRLTIKITMPSFRALGIAGSGEIETNGNFNRLGNVNMSIAGSGDISVSGSAEDIQLEISGSGSIDVAGLTSTDCQVGISGSGDCQVNVGGKLDVSIAGSGSVRYKGSPSVSSSIAGSGSVRSMR
ncbi:MAG: DUF2807 domain-containing protein [Saprospiraceae bacterium]|nr:DUF2807 domain-containing protein [Saprospiraceae bacterium]